eukprot:gene9976-biopygen12280
MAPSGAQLWSTPTHHMFPIAQSTSPWPSSPSLGHRIPPTRSRLQPEEPEERIARVVSKPCSHQPDAQHPFSKACAETVVSQITIRPESSLLPSVAFAAPERACAGIRIAAGDAAGGESRGSRARGSGSRRESRISNRHPLDKFQFLKHWEPARFGRDTTRSKCWLFGDLKLAMAFYILPYLKSFPPHARQEPHQRWFPRQALESSNNIRSHLRADTADRASEGGGRAARGADLRPSIRPEPLEKSRPHPAAPALPHAKTRFV